MAITEFLDREAVGYEVTTHRPAYTAQEVAQEEHVSGRNMAKCVVLAADGQDVLVVVPACCMLDFEAVRGILGASEIRMADEERISELFPDCQIGAEPPFGSLYGLATILDERLGREAYIVFQGGRHDRAIRMDMESYLRIESPMIASFSQSA